MNNKLSLIAAAVLALSDACFIRLVQEQAP